MQHIKPTYTKENLVPKAHINQGLKDFGTDKAHTRTYKKTITSIYNKKK